MFPMKGKSTLFRSMSMMGRSPRLRRTRRSKTSYLYVLLLSPLLRWHSSKSHSQNPSNPAQSFKISVSRQLRSFPEHNEWSGREFPRQGSNGQLHRHEFVAVAESCRRESTQLSIAGLPSIVVKVRPPLLHHVMTCSLQPSDANQLCQELWVPRRVGSSGLKSTPSVSGGGSPGG